MLFLPMLPVFNHTPHESVFVYALHYALVWHATQATPPTMIATFFTSIEQSLIRQSQIEDKEMT